MQTEVVRIKCCDFSNDRGFHLTHYLFTHLRNSGYIVKLTYDEEELQGLTFSIDLTIDCKNVRITLWHYSPFKIINYFDVGVVGWWNESDDVYVTKVKQIGSWCKQYYPGIPIIVHGNNTMWRKYPRHLKEAELAGQKLFNKKMADELVRDIGAVKYIECSPYCGRGFKILVDEIVFAYFSKLRDEEEQQERMKKAADDARRERTKRNLFVVKKFLDVLHYF